MRKVLCTVFCIISFSVCIGTANGVFAKVDEKTVKNESKKVDEKTVKNESKKADEKAIKNESKKVDEKAIKNESKKADKKVIRTNEVVVSASKIDKELQEIPLSVSVLTEQEIAESNAQTVGDLLGDIPGVEVVDNGSQGLKRISIRGEGTRRTLILIDGQRITEHKSVDGTPLLIDPSRIERIEVIKGSASVLYGADAIGGVINIITKKGGKKPIEAEIYGGYSTAGNGFSEGMSIFGSYKGFSYRASINQTDQGNLYTPEGRKDNTGFSATDASIYMDYAFLEKYKVGISYDYFRTNIHSSIEPLALNGQKYNFFQANIPDWQRNKIAVFFEMRDILPYMTRMRLDLFVQENKKEFRNISNVDVPFLGVIAQSQTISTANNNNQQIGLSLQTDWIIADAHLLILGYDFAYDTLKTDNTSQSSTFVPNIPGMIRPTESFGAVGTSLTNALYAQVESPLPHSLVLSYGMRYTFIETNLDSNYTTRAVDTFIAKGAGHESYSHPVFNLGLTWSGIKNLTLRALLSQGFRAPLMQESIFNSSGAEVIRANPNLKPETTNTIEIGARYGDYGLTLDVSTFYTNAENYIVASPIGFETGRAFYEFFNIGTAQTIGVEAYIAYNIKQVYLTPYVSGAFIRRQFDYGTFKTWNSGTPLFTGRAGIRFDKDFPIEQITFYLDVYSRFASNTRLEQPRPTAATGAGLLAREQISVDAFITANANAGIRFGNKRQYHLELSANNLFNTRYIASSAVNQVGAGYIYEPGFFMAIRLGARF